MSPVERSRQEIKRVYWNLRLLGLPEPARDLWMLVLTALIVLALWTQGTDTDRTTSALCALRHDLEARVASGEDFLRTHPAGSPGSPQQRSARASTGSAATINALSNLKCPPQ